MANDSKKKKKLGLLEKTTILFMAFIIVTAVCTSVAIYFIQTSSYKDTCYEEAMGVMNYLAEMMSKDRDFYHYQTYMLEHSEDLVMDPDFEEADSFRAEFDRLFLDQFPGKVYNRDVFFDDLGTRQKEAYVKYEQARWQLVFEQAREAFSMPYTYYCFIDDKNYQHYIIDVERVTDEENGRKKLHLCDVYYQSPETLPVFFETWEKGQAVKNYQYTKNEWGAMNSYFLPYYFDGQKIGLIGVDKDVTSFRAQVVKNTVRQALATTGILVLFTLVVLSYINKYYIGQLTQLGTRIRDFSVTKDVSLADYIKNDVRGTDELAALSTQVASMMQEVSEHINYLMLLTQELSDTKEIVREKDAMAKKDALTGVRNKLAYDDEVRNLQWEIDGGTAQFAMAMIDLNFLKRINDTYGHDKGNIAIQKLCRMVCEIFRHSAVFRIGGDEFAVIMKRSDYENRDHVVERFNAAIREQYENEDLPFWERISAAIGLSVFDPGTDTNPDQVLKRADKQMYQMKKEMKAVRVD